MAQITTPAIDRLLDKIIIDPETGCWIFTGSLTGEGYGQIRVGSMKDGTRRMALAHRVTYEHLVGPIPDGLELDHVKERGCTSRACCCPWHLEPVTRQENLLRGGTIPARNAAKTHCLRGHLFDAENTYVSKRGQRDCRACKRERRRRSAG